MKIEEQWLHTIKLMSIALAKKIPLPISMEWQDLFQEGCVGYLKSRASGDDRYMRMTIYGHMIDAIRRYGVPRGAYTKGIRVINAEHERFASECDIDGIIDVERALSMLKEKEREALENLFILGGTNVSLSEKEGVHYSRISQRVRSGISSIRKMWDKPQC